MSCQDQEFLAGGSVPDARGLIRAKMAHSSTVLLLSFLQQTGDGSEAAQYYMKIRGYNSAGGQKIAKRLRAI